MEKVKLLCTLVEDGRYSTMWLKLYSPRSAQFEEWMDGNAISFQLKTSTQPSDILIFSIAGQEIGRWSGETEWTKQVFDAPLTRPTMFEWKYQKDGGGLYGQDAVWIKEVELIQR